MIGMRDIWMPLGGMSKKNEIGDCMGGGTWIGKIKSTLITLASCRVL